MLFKWDDSNNFIKRHSLPLIEIFCNKVNDIFSKDKYAFWSACALYNEGISEMLEELMYDDSISALDFQEVYLHFVSGKLKKVVMYCELGFEDYERLRFTITFWRRKGTIWEWGFSNPDEKGLYEVTDFSNNAEYIDKVNTSEIFLSTELVKDDFVIIYSPIIPLSVNITD